MAAVVFTRRLTMSYAASAAKGGWAKIEQVVATPWACDHCALCCCSSARTHVAPGVPGAHQGQGAAAAAAVMLSRIRIRA